MRYSCNTHAFNLIVIRANLSAQIKDFTHNIYENRGSNDSLGIEGVSIYYLFCSRPKTLCSLKALCTSRIKKKIILARTRINNCFLLK